MHAALVVQRPPPGVAVHVKSSHVERESTPIGVYAILPERCCRRQCEQHKDVSQRRQCSHRPRSNDAVRKRWEALILVLPS